MENDVGVQTHTTDRSSLPMAPPFEPPPYGFFLCGGPVWAISLDGQTKQAFALLVHRMHAFSLVATKSK
jgi:hypothetical protein